eukprot:TRINITY_DN14156_c0_g1_i1.p1 TRINITY_DN14156_c0_g1~~TRINITY_DN14156_c0_g1_i1.p1  ORF type:complete len:359 (+),score=68.16 TRINITY_DN14156_c0_g1_i1:128-1204(+)
MFCCCQKPSDATSPKLKGGDAIPATPGPVQDRRPMTEIRSAEKWRSHLSDIANRSDDNPGRPESVSLQQQPNALLVNYQSPISSKDRILQATTKLAAVGALPPQAGGSPQSLSSYDASDAIPYGTAGYLDVPSPITRPRTVSAPAPMSESLRAVNTLLRMGRKPNELLPVETPPPAPLREDVQQQTEQQRMSSQSRLNVDQTHLRSVFTLAHMAHAGKPLHLPLAQPLDPQRDVLQQPPLLPGPPSSSPPVQQQLQLNAIMQHEQRARDHMATTLQTNHAQQQAQADWQAQQDAHSNAALMVAKRESLAQERHQQQIRAARSLTTIARPTTQQYGSAAASFPIDPRMPPRADVRSTQI